MLVVDDEPSVCQLVGAILQGTNCVTSVTSSAEEALDLARQGDFDLLVADSHMPVMTGTVLAANARHYLPNLKVLYLTGLSAQLFEGRITLGVNEAYLAKPCTAAGLVEAISLLVYGHIPRPVRRASA